MSNDTKEFINQLWIMLWVASLIISALLIMALPLKWLFSSYHDCETVLWFLSVMRVIKEYIEFNNTDKVFVHLPFEDTRI